MCRSELRDQIIATLDKAFDAKRADREAVADALVPTVEAEIHKAEKEVARLHMALEQAAEWFDEAFWRYSDEGETAEARRNYCRAEYCRAELQDKPDAGR